MSIREGRIIYLHRALPDPQGTNGDYNRPWIIINTKKELERGDDLTIVASTTSFDKPITNPSLFVPLRYGSFSTSRLSAESVAHCGWIFYLPRDDTEIRAFGGMIEWRELDAIRVNVENFILSGGEPREIL